MAKFRTCDYDQMNILPVSIDNQISPYTLKFVIHHIIEDLDLNYFNNRYNNDAIERKVINPKVLLKIILLGYSRGLTSSRDLEKACRENAVFMAMKCGDTPDHTTIATFVSSMEEEIAQVFTQILIICDEERLIGGTHFSIDGVKLSSNASKECSGRFDELLKVM